MKLKYFMTIPLGYLILFFSQRFGLYESRYDMPVLLEEFIYVSLDIFAVLFFVYLYNKYVLKEQWSDIYVCRREWLEKKMEKKKDQKNSI